MPVRAQTSPGDTAKQIPEMQPEADETMESIMDDFGRIVPEGMTHWQHPRQSSQNPNQGLLCLGRERLGKSHRE